MVIQNDTVALSSLPEPTIVALANNTRVQPYDEARGNHPSTLAGVVYLGHLKWNSVRKSPIAFVLFSNSFAE